jgi:hypothetical protein
MISKNAKDFLNLRCCNEKGLIVNDLCIDEAFSAVELSEKELKAKAIEAYRQACFSYSDGICDKTFWECDTPEKSEKCNDNCRYMKKFEELLDK